MSEGEEKTEQPTSFKLLEARKKGRVAKSADLVALLGLASTSAFLFAAFPFGTKKLALFFEELYGHLYEGLSLELTKTFAIKAFNLWFFLSLPVLGIAFLFGVIGNLMQFGFLLSSHPLMPDIKKLNPISGLKKIFSKDRAVELLKQTVKFGTIFSVILLTLKDFLYHITLLFGVSLSSALIVMSDLIFRVMNRVLLCFAIIAIFDFFWQKHSFVKSMRMSKYEVKKEYKQQEGDPHLKQERKRIAQENLEAGSLKNVAQSSVVITNPGHLAAALKYDEDLDGVPILLAKGTGKVAQAIMTAADRAGIHRIRNVPLARDLQWLDINEEIPANLYDSVAEVLTFIQELNEKEV